MYFALVDSEVVSTTLELVLEVLTFILDILEIYVDILERDLNRSSRVVTTGGEETDVLGSRDTENSAVIERTIYHAPSCSFCATTVFSMQ